MTLTDYLSTAGAKTRKELCAEIGISEGRLSQLRDSTDWPPELALKLEKATDGVISASVICPVVAQARAA